ncbi:unnamed protein product, partial [Didymodactylos carnosus]
ISKRGVDIRQRIEKQVTTMLLLQICVECLTTIPLTVQIIYSNITMDIETEVLRLTKENICATITRVLNYINYASRFYIYIIYSIVHKIPVSRGQPTPLPCASKSTDHVPSILIENLIQSSKTQLEQSKTLIDNHHDKIKTHVHVPSD